MEPGVMQIYTSPPEHVGVTWFVIVSPILLVLVAAYISHLRTNPPDMLIMLYNALLRTKKNLLYIQSLELENERLRKLNAALLDDDAETIPFEEMTLYEQWKETEEKRWKEIEIQEEKEYDLSYEIEN
jgi:hypothetical protein